MINLKNKKAGSLSLYGEAILSVMLILSLVAGIMVWMNATYDKDYETGLNTEAIEEWEQLEQTARGQTTGEVTQTDSGLSLTSSWAMAKGVYDVIVSFVTGGFIDTLIVDTLGLPAVLAVVLRILFLMSLIYILIKLFFKVTA